MVLPSESTVLQDCIVNVDCKIPTTFVINALVLSILVLVLITPAKLYDKEDISPTVRIAYFSVEEYSGSERICY